MDLVSFFTSPVSLLLISSFFNTLAIMVLGFSKPKQSAEPTPEINSMLAEDQRRLNQIDNTLRDLKTSGIPKSIFEDIQLDEDISKLSLEETAQRVQTLHEVQNEFATYQLKSRKIFEQVEGIRAVYDKHFQELVGKMRPLTTKVSPERPVTTQPAIPKEAPALFPYVEGKN